MAQRELGLLSYRGLGTAKDPQQAYVWLDIAVRNGDAQARVWRDRLGPNDLDVLALAVEELDPAPAISEKGAAPPRFAARPTLD